MVLTQREILHCGDHLLAFDFSPMLLLSELEDLLVGHDSSDQELEGLELVSELEELFGVRDLVDSQIAYSGVLGIE